MFQKIYIIYLIIFILILLCFKNNFQKHRQENLTNTDHYHSIDYSKIEEMIDNKISITKEDVTKIVKEQYSIDVETIRNLEEIAKKLQTEESLIIPGNLTVRGKLDVDTDGGNVKFRNLNVSNNTNLKNLKVEEKLESKVFDNYSLKDHNHDDTYSKLNHNHDKKYSKLDHNHDNIYSKLKHNHDNTYSKVGHNHDEYAPAGHIHLEYINPDLTDLATKKWVNDKKYVTKDHTHNNLTMTGKLKVKDLEVTNKGIIDELEITNNQSDGSASWNTHFNFEKGGKNYIRGNEFHIQGKNGGQTNVYGEPIFDKNIKATGNIYSDNWVQAKNLKATGNIYSDNEVQAKNLNITDYAKVKRFDIINPTGTYTHFNHDNKGKNYIRGELITNGKITASENIEGQKLVKGKNLHVDDLATVKRLDIIPGNGIWNSHFNYDNKGKNYIRGNDTEIKGSTGGAANLHGNINFKNDVNMGSKLTVKGELNVDKSAIIGNAFVGSSPHSGWAQFSHKNLKDDKDRYAILQDGNGNDTLVNAKHYVRIRKNNQDSKSILTSNSIHSNYIKNGITETVAIRPGIDEYRYSNGAKRWPTHKEMGQVWLDLKPKGVRLGDMVPFSLKYNTSEDINGQTGFYSFMKRPDNTLHGYQHVNERHGRWCKSPTTGKWMKETDQ